MFKSNILRTRLKLMGLLAAMLILVGIAVFAFRPQPYPIPIGTNTRYYGYILQGEKFGIEIGSSQADAQAKLIALGADHGGEDNCVYNARRLFGCRPNERVDYYFAHWFLRHGGIFIVLDGDKVQKIGWSFQYLPVIDF